MTAHLPNMIMVGIFDKAGFSNLNYLNWMLLQAPYLGMFALTQAWIRWHFGTRKVHIAGGVEALQKKYDDLGPMTMPEKVLLGIFALAGIMFMTGKGSFIAELHHQPLGVIGLLGMLVLFAPGLMPCSWKSVQEKTIWGTFLLLGGAMTMTTAMTQSGLAQWLADHIHAWVVGMSWWQAILTMMVGTHIIRLGMLSNVAAVAMLAPVVFAMAPKLGLHPVAFTMLVCDTDNLCLHPAHPDHRGRHRARDGHLLLHGLRPRRLGLRLYRHRLRPAGHGSLVRPVGHARLGCQCPLALLAFRRPAGAVWPRRQQLFTGEHHGQHPRGAHAPVHP